MSDSLFYLIILIGFVGVIFLFTMITKAMKFSYSQEKLAYKGIQKIISSRVKKDDIYHYLRRNIMSCSTFGEVANCHEWVLKHEYNLTPIQLNSLLKLIRQKEREIEENYSDMVGHSIGKMQ